MIFLGGSPSRQDWLELGEDSRLVRRYCQELIIHYRVWGSVCGPQVDWESPAGPLGDFVGAPHTFKTIRVHPRVWPLTDTWLYRLFSAEEVDYLPGDPHPASFESLLDAVRRPRYHDPNTVRQLVFHQIIPPSLPHRPGRYFTPDETEQARSALPKGSYPNLKKGGIVVYLKRGLSVSDFWAGLESWWLRMRRSFGSVWTEACEVRWRLCLDVREAT